MPQRRKSLKPCKSYQYRHPSTNRCRNYKSPPKKRSQKRKSPKRVARSPKRREFVQCKSHQYRNPKTNRCKNLPIQPTYKSSPSPTPIQSSKKIVPVGPGIPDHFKKLSQNCSKINDWKKIKHVGAGAYGSVYQVCKSTNEAECNYVMKSQQENSQFYEEIYAFEDLQSTGVVPILYAAWVCSGIGYLVTELLKPCANITNIEKYEQVKNALNKIKEKGWLHVDVHTGNIMCANDGKKVIMIDFGWAVKKGNKGVNTLYSDHPLVEKFSPGGSLSWKQLSIIQDMNFQSSFNKYGIYDENQYLRSLEEYLKVVVKSTPEDIQNYMNEAKESIEFYKNHRSEIKI